jgi:hypothetical protein
MTNIRTEAWKSQPYETKSKREGRNKERKIQKYSRQNKKKKIFYVADQCGR